MPSKTCEEHRDSAPAKGINIHPAEETKAIKEPRREITVPKQIAASVPAIDTLEKAEPRETTNQTIESTTEPSELRTNRRGLGFWKRYALAGL